MKILIDATLPDIEQAFGEPFIVSLYTNFEELVQLLPSQDILFCRSTVKVDAELLKNSQLRCVATASSGSCHLDKVYLEKSQIHWIDAKGSNAVSVADYVLATLASLEQQGMRVGKQAGILGVGAVGSQVCLRLKQLGYKVVTYDPLRALQDPTFISCDLKTLLASDWITIHASLHHTKPYPSKHLLNADFFSALKLDTTLINAARGGIVDEEALLKAPSHPIYCTDVYQNEPNPNPSLIRYATLCTPHIAGHSVEAKKAAVTSVSLQLHQWLGLVAPYFPLSDSILEYPIYPDQSWQTQILAYYNPLNETQLLKNALGDREVFLELRRAHTFRHDMNFQYI
jgi:erythronate-4-phosphate dehydrogenase